MWARCTHTKTIRSTKYIHYLEHNELWTLITCTTLHPTSFFITSNAHTHTHTQWHTTVCMQARHSHHPHIVSKANRDNTALWWRNYILDQGAASVIPVHKATPPLPCFTILVLVSLSMSTSLNKLKNKAQVCRCVHTKNPQLCQPDKKRRKKDYIKITQTRKKYLILYRCVLFQKTPHNTHEQQQQQQN